MDSIRLKKMVYRDCVKAMLPALVFGAAGDIIEKLLTVYTAMVLGSFADAVFVLNFDMGLSKIRQLALCLLAALVIGPVLGTARELLHFSNSLKHDRFVSARYLDKTYLNGISFPEGEVQYRLEQDPIDLRCRWLEIARKCAVLIMVLPYLVYRAAGISVPYACLVAAISLIKLAVPGTVKKLEAKYDKQEREYRTDVRAYETEIMRCPHMVKLYGLFEALVNQLDRSFADYCKKLLYKSVRCTVIADSIAVFLDTFCFMLILFAGTVMIAQGRLEPGGMVSMMALFPIWNTLIGYIGFIIRKAPILDHITERVAVLYGGTEDTSGKSIGTAADIQAEALSFSYEDKEIINCLDFNINQGDKICICGKNGSGKSTLIKILCGVLEQYQGSIKLNGEELGSIAVKDLRRQLAVVEQDPFLFAGTIRQNIHLGNPDADDKKVKEVMDELKIGYLADREVSAVRNELSGGEKQRVSLARALLKNASLLIFDEPSNNIDEKTEQWLCEFIQKSPKTIIFVSHDDQLLRIADKKIQL